MGVLLLPSLVGSEMGVMLPWLHCQGYLNLVCLSCKQGCQPWPFLLTPCLLPDAPLPTSLCPRSPQLSLSRTLPKGPSAPQAASKPLLPPFPRLLPCL